MARSSEPGISANGMGNTEIKGKNILKILFCQMLVENSASENKRSQYSFLYSLARYERHYKDASSGADGPGL